MSNNNNTVSKTDFIAQLSDELGVSKVQAEKMLNSVLGSIVKVVSGGNNLKLTNFGTFYRAERAPRTGVNPKTKEKITIEGYTTAGFKLGKQFKDSVRQS